MSRGISDMLQGRRISIGQLLFVALLAVALLFDGLDVKLPSDATPSVLDAWGFSKLEFSPALSAALVGMALVGWLVDRLGLHRTAVFGMLLVGITTVACGYADGLLSLALLHIVSGIGYGAVTSNAFARDRHAVIATFPACLQDRPNSR